MVTIQIIVVRENKFDCWLHYFSFICHLELNFLCLIAVLDNYNDWLSKRKFDSVANND